MVNLGMANQSRVLKYGGRKYNQALKKLRLKVYRRSDPICSRWGEYSEYLVAPIIENNKKIGWQIYYYSAEFGNTRETMDSFKTKKEAIECLRDEIREMKDPWYSDLPGYDTAQGVYLGDGVYVH